MDFSELPQHILHHILNFLPTKEAARTSIISKTWKSAWHSRSKVDLDLNIFKPYEENFPAFARKTMERYVEQGLGVESLMISWAALMNNDHQILDSMKQWIDFVFAAGNNLKRLIISASPYTGPFPLNLRASNTLVTLSLYDCKLENNNISESIKFPSLKNLILRLTSLTSDIIHKIFLCGSPFLESFYLIRCDGLESLVVSGLNRGLTFTIEKSSLSWEDLVERRTEGDAIYIASSSSHKTNFNNDEFYEKVRIGWTKRSRYCPDAEPYDLKDIEIESVNLEQDIDIREDIDAALLQAYRALSFKFTRLIYLPYYNKRRHGEIAAKEHRKILKKRLR